MKILVTGSNGRVGRLIYINLLKHHEVVGLDKTPSSSTDVVGDIRDEALVRKALQGVDVIVHTAALHAPHVDLLPDSDFDAVNVDATARLAAWGFEQGIKHFVFTSTTALFGHASTPPDHTSWITEAVTPQPRTVYHRSKIRAEERLAEFSASHGIPVTVLRMSRCFPEPADLMAVYRLNRGVDARDVASAHRAAVERRLSGFRCYIISAATPFTPLHCTVLHLKVILQRSKF